MIKKRLALNLLLCAMLFGCSVEGSNTASYHPAPETQVRLIPLPEPLNRSKAQISGLSWCRGELVLLPQYPEFAHAKGSAKYIYHFTEQQLINFVSGLEPVLQFTTWELEENGLREKIIGFDGYEGIACEQEEIWFTLEVDTDQGQSDSYLVPARFSNDRVELLPDLARRVRSQSRLPNTADEALLIRAGEVFSFHELNSRAHLTSTVAHIYSPDIDSFKTLEFPDLPYRLTDVTQTDEQGRFWGINYFYGGDKFMEQSDDPLFERYGQGATHMQESNVERLLEFQITDTGIKYTGRPPIQLALTREDGRNWEGIARLKDKGLLIVTDEYPQTYFGFVPFNHVDSHE